MKNRGDLSLSIRAAGIAILGLLILLAAAAYLSGQQVKRSSEMITTDAVPGTINAHYMRMAMSRSIGWVMVADSAQTGQVRDACLKSVHDADTAFAKAFADYQTTIKIDSAKDNELLERVTSGYAEYQRQRLAYEALILAGDRDKSAAFLETKVVPAYLAAIQSAEELLKYNHANTIAFANAIYDSVYRLYWTVAIVMVLALFCAAVLVVNYSVRRQEVKELRESEEKFAKAFLSNPIGIAITEMATGEYLEVNESFSRLMGYSPGEMKGRTTFETGVWNSKEERDRMTQPLLDGGSARNLETLVRTRAGDCKTVLLNAELINLGGKSCIVTLVQDITDRKQAEDALRLQTERLDLATRSARIGVWDWNIQKDELIWDDRMYALYGIKREDFLGARQAWLNGLHPDDRDQSDARANQALRGEREFDLEFRVVWPDGSIHTLKANGHVFRNEAGQPQRMIGINYDITDQRKLEDQLRQSQKMEAIGTLAGGIAHDFNNILAAINGYTELAKMHVGGDPVATRYLEAVLQGGERAIALVRQILTFSRRQEQRRLPIRLEVIVAEPLELLRASIPKNIEFDVTLPPGLPTVLADATQIHQIVMNLCTNAAHAMGNRPGRLGVQLQNFYVDDSLAAIHPGLHPGPHVRLSISDTGEGIPQAMLERIFEPFFTTKPPGEGTGLGLSVVHGIVQSHGGAITVYSQPGEGTVFHLYFPASPNGTACERASTEPIPGGRGERILVVDDEKPLALLGQSMLEELGYVVEIKTNPIEVLSIIRANPAAFDLVITDLTMPGMSGGELTEQLLLIRPDLPIIVATGCSASLSEERVLELGARALILKPISLRSLGSLVWRVLDT